MFFVSDKIYFTVDSANRILPKVRDLVEKIILKQTELDSVKDEIEKLENQGSTPNTYLSKKYDDVEELYSQLSTLILELQKSGCLLKDINEGLVDFPAIRLGEQVYLCWKMGEKSVDHWHGVYEGFAGRKRITPDEFVDPAELNQAEKSVDSEYTLM
jgi:hypothetical protein